MNGRRLYEEIGGVSERYLQEASNYRAKRRSGFWRVALIAAAIMLSLAVVLSTLAFSVGLILVDFLRTEQPDPPEQQPEYNTVDGEEVYFIPNPALGLWIDRERFEKEN